MGASQLDEACERNGGVVSFDLPGVQVELREQQPRDRSFHALPASPVERLWVGEQVERHGEEPAPVGELARCVGRLGFDRCSFLRDGGELGLDLLAGPVRVIEEFQVTVFLDVKLPETDVQALAKIGSRLHLVRDRLVDLAAQRLLDVAWEADGSEVLLDGVLDLGHAEEGQVAAALLAAAAEEVEVGAAVALCLGDDKPTAAPVAPHQAFEPVVVLALASAGAAVQGENPLDAVVGLLGDEGLVASGVLDAVEGDLADVVAVGEHVVEVAERDWG